MKTKEKIKILRQNIADYGKTDDWISTLTTKEEMMSDLMMCEEVWDNLDIMELLLIWHLRHTDEFEVYRFYRFAKENYEHNKKIKTLRFPQNSKKKK